MSEPQPEYKTGETQPTPGPWTCDGAESGYDMINDSRGYTVALVGPDPPLEEQVGNTRLIAAAPDLLHAAKKMRDSLMYAGPYAAPQEAMKALEDAIDKAE